MSNANQSQTQKPSRAYYVEPRAFLSRDGQYLTLVLPGNLLVRKHVNFFKKMMGIPFSPKNVTSPSSDVSS